MTEIRAARAADALCLAGQLAQLGYPSELDAVTSRSGLGRALVTAGEQWAVQLGLHTLVVRSNVVRPESHLFYEGIAYQRTATSHVYHKQV